MSFSRATLTKSRMRDSSPGSSPTKEIIKVKRNHFEELSSVSKSKLGELFLTVAEEELMIERQRQNLASLREFEPYAAFTRVDRDHKGYITAKDIAIFVR